MLLGEHEHTIDDKNRLTLPARFRHHFAEGIVVSEWTARNLLNAERIPGARRKTPGRTRSTWLIPATAPARYLARFEG